MRCPKCGGFVVKNPDQTCINCGWAGGRIVQREPPPKVHLESENEELDDFEEHGDAEEPSHEPPRSQAMGLSAAGRKAIAKAQKRRWAAKKRDGASKQKRAAPPSVSNGVPEDWLAETLSSLEAAVTAKEKELEKLRAAIEAIKRLN